MTEGVIQRIDPALAKAQLAALDAANQKTRSERPSLPTPMPRPALALEDIGGLAAHESWLNDLERRVGIAEREVDRLNILTAKLQRILAQHGISIDLLSSRAIDHVAQGDPLHAQAHRASLGTARGIVKGETQEKPPKTAWEISDGDAPT